MTSVDALIRLSAWPAVLCYVATIAIRLSFRKDEHWLLIRTIWTVGWLCLVAHVILAWAWFHGGSWSAAYEHTAMRTHQAVGWKWGGGAWLNLVTAVVWGIDVARTWAGTRAGAARMVWWDAICQTYLGFMIFNATVVFGSRPAQIIGGLLCLGIGTLWAIRLRDGEGSRGRRDFAPLTAREPRAPRTVSV